MQQYETAFDLTCTMSGKVLFNGQGLPIKNNMLVEGEACCFVPLLRGSIISEHACYQCNIECMEPGDDLNMSNQGLSITINTPHRTL